MIRGKSIQAFAKGLRVQDAAPLGVFATGCGEDWLSKDAVYGFSARSEKWRPNCYPLLMHSVPLPGTVRTSKANGRSPHQERDLDFFGSQAAVIRAEAFIEALGQDHLVGRRQDHARAQAGERGVSRVRADEV